MLSKVILLITALIAVTSGRCPDACTAQYDPVCAYEDGVPRQFGNACELGLYNCHNGKRLEGIKGPCPETPRNCPDACIALYDPVCAYEDGIPREFGNACELGIYNCQNGKRLEGVKGKCPEIKCLVACTMQYDPVCVYENGSPREFGNPCQLRVYNCQEGKRLEGVKGPCPIKTSRCNDKCTDEYDPVCAVEDGTVRKFGNGCRFALYMCQTGKRLRPIKRPCPQPL